MQNASSAKRRQLFIRKFARIYTPAVTGLAALIIALPLFAGRCNSRSSSMTGYTGHWSFWLSPAVRPRRKHSVRLLRRHRRRLRLGVLFKGGNYLDAITQVDTVVFDKTVR